MRTQPQRGYRRPVPHTNVEQTRQSPRRRVARPKQINPNTKVQKRGKVYYVIHKTPMRVPWRVIIALAFVFIGAIGSAYSYARIHSVQREIRQNRQALNNQLTSNTLLDSMIVERYTLNEIERRALELGLRPPDPSQIIYFHVPRISGVSVAPSEVQPPATENYFWRGVLDFFRGIPGFFRR